MGGESPITTVEQWIGIRRYEEVAEIEVDLTSIRASCASAHNANPIFWDDAVAEAVTSGFVAPPSMISVWLRPHFWSPHRADDGRALMTHYDLKELFRLPEGVITDNELTFFEPVRLGDRLRTYQLLRSVSDEKSTKVGCGRFWVIDAVIENQAGAMCAIDRYTGFGYEKSS